MPEPCSGSLAVCRTRTVTTVENRHQGLAMVLARSRGLDYLATFCARHPAMRSGLDYSRLPVFPSFLLRIQNRMGLVLKLLKMRRSSPSQVVCRRCHCSCRGKSFLHVDAAQNSELLGRGRKRKLQGVAASRQHLAGHEDTAALRIGPEPAIVPPSKKSTVFVSRPLVRDGVRRPGSAA